MPPCTCGTRYGRWDPRLDDKSWSENLFYGDIRNVNGYEWIEPRQ